jgi:hypothetical protein
MYIHIFMNIYVRIYINIIKAYMRIYTSNMFFQTNISVSMSEEASLLSDKAEEQSKPRQELRNLHLDGKNLPVTYQSLVLSRNRVLTLTITLTLNLSP